MNLARIFLAALLLLGSPANLLGAQQQLIGGPCEYESYPGRATIAVSRPRALRPGEQNPGYAPYEVTFTFAPDGPVPRGLFVPERQYRLTLTDGSDPGPRFVAKYRLRPGQTRKCLLQAIKKGTCTPVMFFFPGLDSSDYSLPR
jgi:hypothetical protein